MYFRTGLIAFSLMVFSSSVIGNNDTSSSVVTNKDKSEKFDFSKEKQLSLLEHDAAVSIQDSHDSDLLVLNFWATWCGPCVKELPYFQAVHEQFKDKGVRVVGYSEDYSTNPDDYKEVAQKTLTARGVTFPNYVMNVDPSVTYPEFSKNWQGNLPATFIFNREGELVAEVLRAMDKEELMALVEEKLAEVKNAE